MASPLVKTTRRTPLTEGRIVIHNPALWRPLIDVEDACDAYLKALEADLTTTGVFNIATRNYTLQELGDIVAGALREFGIEPAIQIEHRREIRSYRVQTGKAAEVLNFHPHKAMSSTVHDIMTNLAERSITQLDDPRYYNIRQMQRLMAEGILRQDRSFVATPQALIAGIVR
jgi:nucleoside-diphosphate-sugar epimerase